MGLHTQKDKSWLYFPLCFQNWNKKGDNQSSLRIWEKEKKEKVGELYKTLSTKQEEIEVSKEQTRMKP